MTKWNRVRYEGDNLFNIGILDDGTLHNPNGYPDDLVRAAVLAADARRHERRSVGAKKAAVTRARRQEKRITEAVKRVAAGQGIGNSSHCYVCGRGLGDPESIKRGIGPECWQVILDGAERLMCSSVGAAA